MRPGSHPPRSLPCIDLSFGHRPAEQSPGTADGRFQVGCIKPARGVGCRLQSRDDFPIKAAMMFLGTFFEVPVQVCWNVFQRDRRHVAPVTVPFWLSTWRAAACEESRDCFSAMRSTAQGGSAQLLPNARHAGEGAEKRERSSWDDAR